MLANVQLWVAILLQNLVLLKFRAKIISVTRGSMVLLADRVRGTWQDE